MSGLEHSVHHYNLEPDGANEAESENMAVVRGDYSKQFLLDRSASPRAKMMVIADDNVHGAPHNFGRAGSLNPTMRIVVRTRYISDAEHLPKPEPMSSSPKNSNQSSSFSAKFCAIIAFRASR
jgi:CPA2 family monovalent cation:H+ antiporter-2